MIRGKKERTGHTGTMEYMVRNYTFKIPQSVELTCFALQAPETLVLDSQAHYRPSDSHSDMWSLGSCFSHFVRSWDI